MRPFSGRFSLVFAHISHRSCEGSSPLQSLPTFPTRVVVRLTNTVSKRGFYSSSPSGFHLTEVHPLCEQDVLFFSSRLTLTPRPGVARLPMQEATATSRCAGTAHLSTSSSRSRQWPPLRVRYLHALLLPSARLGYWLCLIWCDEVRIFLGFPLLRRLQYQTSRMCMCRAPFLASILFLLLRVHARLPT